MLEIDGSRFSGSGTIVRQAVAFSALTGHAVHLVNARARRPNPGLRLQHKRVIEAIGELVDGTTEGVHEGSREFTFRPGNRRGGGSYCWDIGSAGSTTMLALSVLPVLAFGSAPTDVEIRGGLFQDFAPSVFHVQQVILPLLRHMGLHAVVDMQRPGYVPRGGGSLVLKVTPLHGMLNPVVIEERGPVERIWGIALSSHLAERKVSHRMAEAAMERLVSAGYKAEIEIQYDTTAPQPGAALAVFAECRGGIRLGADRAGALGRPAEAIGRYVASQLLEELKSGATLDRFAADQIIPFAALAAGESRFSIPMTTDHIQSSAWMAALFLGADVRVDDHTLSIRGAAFRPETNTHD